MSIISYCNISLADVEVERRFAWHSRFYLLLVSWRIAILDVDDGQVSDPEGCLDVGEVLVQNGFLVEGLPSSCRGAGVEVEGMMQF